MEMVNFTRVPHLSMRPCLLTIYFSGSIPPLNEVGYMQFLTESHRSDDVYPPVDRVGFIFRFWPHSNFDARSPLSSFI